MAVATSTAILGAAALSAGAGLYGASQVKKAARAQVGAAEQAGQLAYKQYQQTREDLTPWRTTGKQALQQYSQLLGIGGRADFGAFERSPGYQFRQAEGLKAVERSAAARGLLGSGGTLKAITEYGQGVASQEYGAYANRLAALAGVGQAAVTTTGQFGAQAAGQQAGALQAAGAARASGYLGQAQALTGAVSDIAGLGGYYVGQQQNEALIAALGRG